MNENMQTNPDSPAVSRRQFLKTSSLAAASAAAANMPFVITSHAAADDALRVANIGCGGRGRGAGDQAQKAGPNVKVVALADAFQDSVDEARRYFKEVPAENCFVGLDAYAKAIAVPEVNYVILASPPGFRPAHFKACAEAGKHVFMEKPVAVDGPGIRSILESGKVAEQKGLKVAAGTQRRHEFHYRETIKRIQDGMIGDIMALRAYWVNGGPIWHRAEQEAKAKSDLERQVRNWYHYIWVCGDHICEQHVHNLDVCNWIMGDHPIKCWGMGARQQLGGKSGEIWDNFAVEFEYPSGVRTFSYCGQINRDWASVSEAVQGAKGVSDPSGWVRVKGGENWKFSGKRVSGWEQEHVHLVNAIRNGEPLNETQNVAYSTLTAIMGREAAYSGAAVEWDQMLNSTWKYGPEILYTDPAKLTWGPFRTLKPPTPKKHNIFKDPPVVAGA